MVAMGSAASKPESSWSTPLECLLANVKNPRLTGYTRPKGLTFLCSEAWPQYPLDNDSHWPPTGTLDFEVLRALDNCCRRTGKWSEVPYVQAFWTLRMGKWSEVPYVQAFWTLRSRPTRCATCSLARIMLTMAPKRPACPKPDPPPKESPGPESSAVSVPQEDLVAPRPMLLRLQQPSPPPAKQPQ